MKKIISKFKFVWSVARAVNPSMLQSMWIVLGFLVLAVWNRTGINQRLYWKISIKKESNQYPFYMTTGSDLAVMKEVFLNNEYEGGVVPSSGIVFDLGSNVGLTVLYFKLRFPEAKVIAVEADPQTYELLKRNTKTLKDVECINAAVTDKDGAVDFYVYPNSNISSSMVQRTPDQKAISVPAKTINTLMKEAHVDHIDLMKFDIEGAEFKAFSHVEKIDDIKMLIGEIHLDLDNHSEEYFVNFFPHHSAKVTPITEKRKIVELVRTS